VSGISAQVSLYPLGQVHLSPAITTLLRVLDAHGLAVEAGVMSSVVSGESTAVFAALQAAFNQVAQAGRVVMLVTYSNACPIAVQEATAVTYTPIGHVVNSFDAPAAPDLIRATESQIVLNPAYVAGLSGLEAGQQLMVVFHFHHARGYDLRQHPRGDASRPARGVFALRSPRRPNPLGVTVVELLAIQDNVLRVRGLDALNQTPVLDLKPAG
jgi:tRNA (adenine37-N6)-methyltransferase